MIRLVCAIWIKRRIKRVRKLEWGRTNLIDFRRQLWWFAPILFTNSIWFESFCKICFSFFRILQSVLRRECSKLLRAAHFNWYESSIFPSHSLLFRRNLAIESIKIKSGCDTLLVDVPPRSFRLFSSSTKQQQQKLSRRCVCVGWLIVNRSKTSTTNDKTKPFFFPPAATAAALIVLRCVVVVD